ncbi:MAG: TetR family transcriptional regulator [Alphaproteobacteria bacterium]
MARKMTSSRGTLGKAAVGRAAKTGPGSKSARVAVGTTPDRRRKRSAKDSWRVAVRDSERTTAQILAAAVSLIETEGESGVRVHQLARKAGRTMGAVYHHFESREGLIEAARAQQFRGRMESDIAAMDEAIARSRTPQELVDSLVGVLRVALAPERREARWSRVDVVGCARARPSLAEILGTEQHRIMGLSIATLQKAQDRGLLRSDVDVESLALLSQQLAFAFVLADIDPESGIDADRYSRFAGMLLGAMLPETKSATPRRRVD